MFQINIKCIWLHPAPNNNLELTKIERSKTDQPIVITLNSFSQLQPEIWKLPIKQGTQELTSLLSTLHENSVFAKINNTHPLSRYLVKELCFSANHWSLATRQQNQNNPKPASNLTQW